MNAIAAGARRPLAVIAVCAVALAAADRAALATGRTVDGSQREEAGLELRVAQEGGADFTIRNINGVAGRPAPVVMTIPSALSFEYALLLFRGLPDGVKLSAGFRFQDAWAVSLKDVGDLALLTEPGYEGRFVIEATLVKGSVMSPAKQAVVVQISRPSAPGAEAPLASVHAGLPLTAKQTGLPVIAKEKGTALDIPASQEATLLAQAQNLLGDGDVAAARLLFEHLAKHGSAQGAMAMAQTYDPNFLQNIPAVGLQPDVAKARQWYLRAAELGASDAGSRLSALDTGAR